MLKMRRRMRRACGAAVLVGVCGLAGAVSGWDAHGHRTITLLALDGMAERIEADGVAKAAAGAGASATPGEEATGGGAGAGREESAKADGARLPRELEFLATQQARTMVAWEASEPDRWRGTASPFLAHENSPDHYLDIEDLEPLGLTLSTVPPLRYEYVRAMVIAKHEHPENLPPYNERTDPNRIQEFPGYLPHAIVEHFAKLTSAMKTLRTLEKLADPTRAAQLEMARANVMVEMGMLSHFVGDAAQPLHTTRHHHGWVGENPDGFTTDRGIHAYIDGEILRIHGLGYDALRPGCEFDRGVDGAKVWEETLAHIERSFAEVRPLYELKKSGELEQEKGKEFISARLRDAGEMLAAMYAAAWKAAEPDEKAVADFVKYDGK